jgi:VanZ family protein
MNSLPAAPAPCVARFFRVIAWLLVTAIVILSIVPAGLRPVTAAPHEIEHVLIFVLTGFAFGLAYQHRRALQLASLTLFTAVVEIAQSWSPTRHARISDFLVDMIGCLVGVGLATFALRFFERLRST